MENRKYASTAITPLLFSQTSTGLYSEMAYTEAHAREYILP